MTPRFFQKFRDGKTFLIPFRREVPQPPTPAVQTFTRQKNKQAHLAARALKKQRDRQRNKVARRSRKRNRV